MHSTALAQVDFTITLCGKIPRLQSGARCPPHAIALLLFQYFIHKREWKELKRVYKYLYNKNYDAFWRAVLTRWLYVFRAADQLTSRWGIIKAAALCKVAKLRDPVAYEQQHNQDYPAPQPIAVVCGKAYYAPNPSADVVVSPLSATTPRAVSPEINYIGSLVIYDWGPEIGDVEG